MRRPRDRADGKTSPSRATRASTREEGNNCPGSRSRVVSFKPMSRQTNEYIFERRLVNADGIDLPRKSLDQVRDELVTVRAFNADTAIQHLRLDPEPFTDLLGER